MEARWGPRPPGPPGSANAIGDQLEVCGLHKSGHRSHSETETLTGRSSHPRRHIPVRLLEDCDTGEIRKLSRRRRSWITRVSSKVTSGARPRLENWTFDDSNCTCARHPHHCCMSLLRSDAPGNPAHSISGARVPQNSKLGQTKSYHLCAKLVQKRVALQKAEPNKKDSHSKDLSHWKRTSRPFYEFLSMTPLLPQSLLVHVAAVHLSNGVCTCHVLRPGFEITISNAEWTAARGKWSQRRMRNQSFHTDGLFSLFSRTTVNQTLWLVKNFRRLFHRWCLFCRIPGTKSTVVHENFVLSLNGMEHKMHSFSQVHKPIFN